MSFFANIYTDALELTDAKKLLSNIQKQPPPGGWNHTFGPGGSEKEVKLTDLTGEMLKDFDLTSYWSSLMPVLGASKYTAGIRFRRVFIWVEMNGGQALAGEMLVCRWPSRLEQFQFVWDIELITRGAVVGRF